MFNLGPLSKAAALAEATLTQDMSDGEYVLHALYIMWGVICMDISTAIYGAVSYVIPSFILPRCSISLLAN